VGEESTPPRDAQQIFLTFKEAQEFLGVSHQTLYHLTSLSNDLLIPSAREGSYQRKSLHLFAYTLSLPSLSLQLFEGTLLSHPIGYHLALSCPHHQ